MQGRRSGKPSLAPGRLADNSESCPPPGGLPDKGAEMNKQWKSLASAALLMVAAGAWAQVGVLQGTVTGVKAGTVLPVFKGDAKVADIKVEEGGKFSVPLATG